jgi:hypothetical protein
MSEESASRYEGRPGFPIKDARYKGKERPQKDGRWLISPNIEWEPPIYHPFTKNELVAVHLTGQDARDSGILKPHSYKPYQFRDSIQESELLLMPRETLHFTLNGVVADHTGGEIQEHVYTWTDDKFAYLIPFHHIYDQVISVFTHDTIALGQLPLPQDTVIIENQNREKVLEAVAHMGYRPLDIRGSMVLDPAFLLGTKKNVNHPANFASMIDNTLVDGPYTSRSDNNILALDSLLTDVLTVLGHRNNVIPISQGLIDEVQRRMKFFTDRYAHDPNRGAAITRLQKISDVYIQAMNEDLAYQKLKQPYDDNSPKAYFAREEEFRNREKEIADIISWNNVNRILQGA